MMQYLEQRENLHDDSPSLSYTQPAKYNNNFETINGIYHKGVQHVKLMHQSFASTPPPPPTYGDNGGIAGLWRRASTF